MEPVRDITAASLLGVTVRQRAMLKLQYGWLPLTEEEMEWVLPERRDDAAKVKQRQLQEVAALFGLSRERIRQVNTRSLKKLGLQAWKQMDKERGVVVTMSVSCKSCGHEVLVDATLEQVLLERTPVRAGPRQVRLDAALSKLVCKCCGSRDAQFVPEAHSSSQPQCASCGCPIPPERLEAIPTATLCVQCQK